MFYLSSVNALSLFLQHREEMVYGQRWGRGDDEDQSTQSGDDLIYHPCPFFTCPLSLQASITRRTMVQGGVRRGGLRDLGAQRVRVCGTAFWIHKRGKRKNNNHSKTQQSLQLPWEQGSSYQTKERLLIPVKGKINPP